MRRGFLGWVCGAAILAGAGGAAAADPVVGQAAPDFQATTAEGKEFSLADFKGQVLVLNFWAAWCAPCNRQLPLLDSYYRLQEKFGLRVLAVANEPSVSLRERKSLSVLAMPLARRFKGDYGPAESAPLSYVIDRSGVLRYAKAAALTLEDLNAILIPLLREQESPGIESDGPTGRKMNGS